LVVLFVEAPACAVGARELAPLSEHSAMEKTGLVLGSILCSAAYTPVKAAYAAGGTVTGGLMFIMSAGQSSRAAGNTIGRSTRGDWFVRPSHLTGNRQLQFRSSAYGR
jgi:hypothetical protein